MKTSLLVRSGFVMAILLIVVACGSNSPAPTATPSPIPAPPTPELSEAEEPSAHTGRIFRVVPEESEALYRVEEEFFSGAVQRLGKELGFFTTIGTTQEIEGELELEIDDAGTVTVKSGQFTVNIRSLESDDSRRDRRIREDFLESDTFPIAEFTITGVADFPANYVEGEEANFKMTGDMTIREITQEVTFETTAVLAGDTLTGTAVTTLMMVDFGFIPPEISGLMKAQDPATIEITLTAREIIPD